MDFESQTFWGLVSLVLVPRVRVPDVGHKSLSPQGEVFVKSLVIVALVGGILVRPGLCLPYTSLCDCFILCCGRAISLVFKSFSEEIIPCVAVDFSCPLKEVCSGYS